MDFTLDGNRYQLTRDMVIRCMKGQTPGRIQKYAVDVEDVLFPVKQVLAQALQVPVTSFVSTRAQDILSKLGFKVFDIEEELEGLPDEGRRVDGGAREVALRFAIELFKDRQNATPEDVLAAAMKFEDWLSGV